MDAARNLSLVGRDEQAVALVAGLDLRLLAPEQRTEAAVVRASAAIRWHGRPLDCVPELVATARELAPSHPGHAMRLIPMATFAAWQGWDQTAQLDVARVAATIDVARLGDTARHLGASVAGFAAADRGRSGDRRPAPRRDHRVGPHRRLPPTGDLGELGGRCGSATRTPSASSSAGPPGCPVTGARSARSPRPSACKPSSWRSSPSATTWPRAPPPRRSSSRDEIHADSLTLLPRSALAIVAAVRGDEDDARRQAEEVLELARTKGHPFRASPAVYSLAVLDMAAGRWTDALDHLGRLTDTNDPALAIVCPEIVESAVRAGRPDEAQVALAALRDPGRAGPYGSRCGRGWPAAGRSSLRGRRPAATTRTPWR